MLLIFCPSPSSGTRGILLNSSVMRSGGVEAEGETSEGLHGGDVKQRRDREACSGILGPRCRCPDPGCGTQLSVYT